MNKLAYRLKKEDSFAHNFAQITAIEVRKHVSFFSLVSLSLSLSLKVCPSLIRSAIIAAPLTSTSPSSRTRTTSWPGSHPHALLYCSHTHARSFLFLLSIHTRRKYEGRRKTNQVNQLISYSYAAAHIHIYIYICIIYIYMIFIL